MGLCAETQVSLCCAFGGQLGEGEVLTVWVDDSPFIPYDSISFNGTRLAKIQSLKEFENDVEMNTLPQYAHMSPDMMDDGHNTTLEFAAKWSKDFLMPLLANEQFMNRTLVLLTYDESATYPIPNKIVSLLLGGAVPTELKGTEDDTFYTHYSILSTLENNWDLPNLGRYDVGANVFDMVAKKTGWTGNHAPVNAASVNNSLSYSGFLNNDPAMYTPVPPPNLQLIGAGGQGVDRMVKIQWAKEEKALTPYDGSGALADGGDGTTNPNATLYKAQIPAPTLAKGRETKRSSGDKVDMKWASIWVFMVAAFFV